MTIQKKSNLFIINTNDAIHNSTLRVYVEEILDFTRQIGLSDARWPFVRRGVEDVEVGEFISVGTSPDFDLDRISRAGYITEQGYKPIFDIVKDFNEIKRQLLKYAVGANVPVELYCVGEVTFHRGFIKINSEEVSVIVKNEELIGLAQRAIQLNLFH